MRVRYVSSVLEWGHPDAILLPGTKSTLSDLRWMRETGLGPLIQAQAARGVPVFGICGGYQMLGKQVDDPYGEDGGGSLPGMGPASHLHAVCPGENHPAHEGSMPGNIRGLWAAVWGRGGRI